MDVMELRRGLMTQMANDLWKIKHFTVNASGTNAAQLKQLLEAELPTGYTFAFFVNDNQDWTTYPDKQFIFAVAPRGQLLNFARYNLSTDNTTVTSSWGIGTGVVTNSGDKYTMMYQ